MADSQSTVFQSAEKLLYSFVIATPIFSHSLHSLNPNAGSGLATTANVFTRDVEDCSSSSFVFTFAPHSLCLPLESSLVTEEDHEESTPN